jgi:hypothetical protein
MALMGGEIDNILYIVLLLAYWLIIYVGHNLGLFLATLLIVAGLAMHEAFLLMFYPLIFVLIFHLLHRRRLTASGVGIHCAVVLLSFTAILAHGKFHGDQATWVAHAQQRTDMPIEGAVFIPLHNTLAEQLSFVRHRYTRSLIIRVLLTLALSLPYGIALWRLLVGTIQRQNYSALFRQIITATFFLPLCLIPLGHDVMRWIAALCINMSIYVLVIYQENKSDTGQTAEAVRALRYWSDSPATASTFLYLLIIGPWGLAGTHLFSNITRVLISTRDFLN